MAVAQGPAWPRSEYKEIVQIKDVGANTFSLHHVGFVQKLNDNESYSEGHALLNHRSTHLLDRIINTSEYVTGDIHGSFLSAFKQMDEELEAMVKKLNWKYIQVSKGHLWKTCHNTMVVMVNHKTNKVYIAGDNGLVKVLLARGGKDYMLSDFDFSNTCRVLREASADGEKVDQVPGVPVLHFYREAYAKSSDRYLIVVSARFWLYLKRGLSIARILESRVAQVGLEVACKSMCGRFPDYPKSIVAVPLNTKQFAGIDHEVAPNVISSNFSNTRSRRVSLGGGEEFRGAKMIRLEIEDPDDPKLEDPDELEDPDDAEKNSEEDNAEDEDEEMPWEDDAGEMDLLPWEDGDQRPIDPIMGFTPWYQVGLYSRDPMQWVRPE